ncbi:MAG: hypothetical protein ACRDK5_02625 [Solirubrobacterales bacterium]
MRDGGPAAIVCGFSDLAAGLGGLAWGLGGRGGLLLNSNEVQAAEVGLSPEGEGVRLEMRTEGAEVEAMLAPIAGAVEPHVPEGAEPPGGALEAAICTATIRSKGWGRTFQCPGHFSRWASDPIEGASRFRYLAIEAAEGSLLLLASRGAPGAENHGDEEAAAWLLDSEGGITAFGETLLSSQYDETGRPTRVGLELWREGDEQTTRAAATRAAGTRLGGTELVDPGTTAVLLRCSTEGTEGLGGYLIWRG